MATTHTITGSIADWIPGVDPRRVRAVAYLNIPATEVVVEDSGKVWTASKAVNIDATLGTFAAELLATNATDLNVEPDTLRWSIQLSVVDQQTRLVGQRPQADRRTVTLGPFPVTADGSIGDLTEHFDTPAVSPQWRSEYRAELEGVVAAAEAARDEAALIALGDADAALAGAIGNPSSLAGGALNAAIADALPLSGSIQATARKLADPVGDVKILVIGDSTSSSPSLQFPEFLMPLIQAAYPHRTLRKRQWDNGTKTYGAATQVGPSGTGSTFIDYYAGGVGGTIPETNMGAWEAYVAAVQPDCVIIHFGHNYGKDVAGAGVATEAAMDEQFRERMMRLTLRVKDSCPDADVMLNSQNPYLTAGARTGVSSVRAQIIRSIAADLGCAYGPVCEAFIATGNPSAYLQADLLHPTFSGSTNGADLTAKALLPQFRQTLNTPVAARVPSTLSTVGKQLLKNGNFAAFASPPTLTDWTASAQATLSKDTGIYESPQGYSVKITAAGGGYATLYQTIAVRQALGKWITVAARVFVPAGSTIEAGRLRITGDGGLVTANSAGMASLKDQWAWIFASARVPASATFATVTLYGGFTAGDITYVDRVSAVVGRLPREVA